MQRLLLATFAFAVGALAQNPTATASAIDGIPIQCLTVCSSLYSIAYTCANSTGYSFDDDITRVQQYLNCLCSSSSSDAINACMQCGQQNGVDLGDIGTAQQACASGSANLASFTSAYGTDFTGMASLFTSPLSESATATATHITTGSTASASMTAVTRSSAAATGSASGSATAQATGTSGATRVGYSGCFLSVVLVGIAAMGL